jgi:hypothetical protein
MLRNFLAWQQGKAVKDTFFVIYLWVERGGGRKVPKNCHVLFEYPKHNFNTLWNSVVTSFEIRDDKVQNYGQNKIR